MNKEVIILDIETGPALPDEELKPLLPPFEPPGNIKDPDKLKEREARHYEQAIQEAALDPITGKVVAVGLMQLDGLDGDEATILTGDEKDILKACFTALAGETRIPTIVTFNGHSFDLPFLFRRAWINGIKPPGHLRNGRYWSNSCLDLREAWTFGDRYAKGSLDTIARALGLPGKNGNGKDFHKLLQTNREEAIAYLKQDLAVTAAVYRRMFA